MEKTGSSFKLNASDLVGYLNCRHLSVLDRKVAEGALPKPAKGWKSIWEILWERGALHEQAYVEHLKEKGAGIAHVHGIEVTDDTVALTLKYMKEGADIIVQGALANDDWVGRADILRRVDTPSGLGDWSYEVLDTKLARETKAGTVLQLCMYSDLLSHAQELLPENMYVVAPWSGFEPQKYRFADYAAYFRKVKLGLIESLGVPAEQETYPNPIEHCHICRWQRQCDQRRRDDDHLCLVAGISKIQTNELESREIATVQGLAATPVPLTWKPNRGAVESYERVREQARIQVEGRETGEDKYELLPVEDGFGLTRLPAPNQGDIFFDLEGDSFVDECGLEYLFGYLFMNESGAAEYAHEWAFTRSDERQAFEQFVDFVMARWNEFPDLHIYHYAPYEPAALKRLMGRYATREEEIDRMLRAGLFVDLYQIVRRGLRASVENYSIKSLEPFYKYHRDIPLHEADIARMTLQSKLELGDVPSISDAEKTTVSAYNKDDCDSARRLRDWLEGCRTELIASGSDVPRPPLSTSADGEPGERITDWLNRLNKIFARLTVDLPDDPNERNHEQQARWVLANTLDWHRREEKAAWWEYFRLADLSAEDLLDERAGLSGLNFIDVVGGTNRAPIHRYAFPIQETDMRGTEDLHIGLSKFGKVEEISFSESGGVVDIKKRQDTADVHSEFVFMHTHIGTDVIRDALAELGEYVTNHGMVGDGPYQAARDLLLKESPRTDGQPLRREEETTVEAAIRLCEHLDVGILPIQGPPGAGKTYTGAQMVCELVQQGKTVGVTANSHKVIRNFLDKIIEIAGEKGIEELQCCQKVSAAEGPLPHLSFTKDNNEIVNALGQGVHVGGGTAWFWSRADARDLLDVLFVDEAAQMSLANVLAVSQAAKTVVLIGDPQQLDQPIQGSHPDGITVSSLEYILDGAHTIPPHKGLFLEESWRLHPSICAYTSELFYDSKLGSKTATEQQIIKGSESVIEAGLFYIPVHHQGNQNSSPEEANAVVALIEEILDSQATWVDSNNHEQSITLEDVLIITPYNAQVFEIQQRLPDARVGTVDKFQGQEAPIAIYSMATSSYADAPRGMEFLYSLNRLNVATSRAKCVSIIVASPEIFEAECRTPRQMQLANAFCRYLEIAKQPADLP